jgi:D-glycero-alpha-D-manno-heptose-7-phosphate kinase
MTVTATAPVRLDFAGGWTDVEPFASEVRGVVVNAAIELRAEVMIEPGGSGWRLDSKELGQCLELESPGAIERATGLDLLRAAVRVAGIGPCRITTRSAAPPGSGLGSSGALDVALIAALETAAGRSGTAPEWAEAAWRLEAVEAGLPGGKQDQYAAALGGWNRLAFAAGGVVAERIAIEPDFAEFLARHLVVAYTGRSRVSSRTIERVQAKVAAGDPVVTRALHGLVDVAERMAEALGAGAVGRIGELLAANWRWQQQLDDGMQTAEMAALEAAMARAGSLGGKAAGAGAGGTMLFLIDGDPAAARAAARAAGATVLPVEWAILGVRIW